ncbi:MAG: ASKHA domain-containing protein [Clostridium sp.]
MAVINIINKNIEIHVKDNTLLSDAIREKLNIETPCEGRGTCGKCKVRASGDLSKISESEKKFIKDGERLACKTYVGKSANVEIHYESSIMKTINRGYRKEYTLSSNNREGYSIAIDLGTTGISGYIIDNHSGDVLESSGTTNSQTLYGSDVLTRAEYQISNPNGLKNLQNKASESINKIVDSLVSKSKVNSENIKKVIISGNTIMLHLLKGERVDSLVSHPFESVFLESINLNGYDIGLSINTSVILLPSISSFVGSDITSGMVACDFENRKNSLFIDIGTNGEIGVNLNGEIYASATAAGPAFEGSNIECGMRAENGAIDSFYIEDNKYRYTTINNSTPKGICGSGIIDIVGEMVKNNIILKSGKINLEKASMFKVVDKKVYITEDVYISQEDIRAFQLAKGAIVSGINILCKKSQIDNINEFVIGGSFGYHLREESLKNTGIVPKTFKGSVKFLGNLSLEGAYLACVNTVYIDEMSNLSKKVKSINLSLDSDFQNEFVRSLRF